jgi:hypothetical protein
MNRKLEMQDLDMPVDDIDCWNKYPKHRWVYESSRLLESQNIKWSPFETETLDKQIVLINLKSRRLLNRQSGTIWIKSQGGRFAVTETYIVKGEIKLMRHIDAKCQEAAPAMVGEVELRISAFVSLYFQKFTGVITTETYGNEIHQLSLRSSPELLEEKNAEVIKLLRRIYKKTDISLSGLTDQVLRETLTS